MSTERNSWKTDDDRLLSDCLEALVDSSVPGKVEHFEIAVWCIRYIWCNWYLGSKGHTVPWRTLDATFGSAAAFNAVSGRVRKYLAFTVFLSCNQSFVPARTQNFIFLSILSINCLEMTFLFHDYKLKKENIFAHVYIYIYISSI